MVKKIKLRRVIEGSSDAHLFNRLLRKIKSSIDVILVRIYSWIPLFSCVIALPVGWMHSRNSGWNVGERNPHFSQTHSQLKVLDSS